MNLKQTFFLVALAIGLLLFAGGHANDSMQAVAGMRAPELMVPQADSLISEDRQSGDYTLLCFWSSTDAASRRDANLYTAWLRANADAPVKVIGVNFDDSESLFNEIVRRDSLVAADQFYVSGDTAALVAREYGLSKGEFGSVLIGPDGKIVQANPTEEFLSTL